MIPAKTLVYLFLTIIALSSCVKIEDGKYLPGSMPYSLSPKQIRDNEFDREFSHYCDYDSSIKSDYIYVKSHIIDPIDKSNTRTSYMKLRPDIFAYDGVNFSRKKYPGLLKVFQLPCIYDYNRNGSKDWFFYLHFNDSLLLMGYDSILQVNKKRQLRHDFYSASTHYLSFLAVWDDISTNTRNLIFVKSNRLYVADYKVDTLIAYNLDKQEVIFSMPMGCDIRETLQFYQRDSLLALNSYDPQNNLTYNGFDDHHQYVFVFNKDGMVWADTLSGPKKSSEYGFFMFYHDSKYIYTNKIIKDEKGSEKKYFVKYIKSTGEIAQRLPDERNVDNLIGRLNGHFLFEDYDDGQLVMYDDSLKLIKKKKDPDFSGLIIGPKCLIQNENIGEGIGEHFADINGDSVDDFFLVNSEKQIVVIDGKAFEPLLATNSFDIPPMASFIRDNGKATRIIVDAKHSRHIYSIFKTPMKTRILQWKSEIYLAVVFIVVLPLAIFISTRIQYFRVLLQSLTSRSGSLGVVVFDKNLKIRSVNKIAKEILRLNKKVEKLDDFDDLADIVNLLQIQKFAPIYEYELTINGCKYLSLNGSILKAFGNKTYYLLTINDITNAINDQKRKNELKTAVGVAHGLKTPLGTILLRFEVLQNMVLNNYTEPEIQKSKDLILKNINLSRDTIRQISYIAKEMSELPKDNYSLKELLENWIENYSPRYNNYNIDVRASLSDNLPVLRLNPKSIELLLLTACDNSMQAMPKSRENKFIEFRLEQNKGNVQFSIIDNGSGMSPETLKKVQENTGYTSKATGSGLGMQLIRKVCEEHEADLNIESEKDKFTNLGITFKI